ncbi:hypothetical protein COB87_002460 [Candidatus Wolfebacteria bacterium]|nr:hypothetical protein [Candidatus Wolfebacteria bacterium]
MYARAITGIIIIAAIILLGYLFWPSAQNDQAVDLADNTALVQTEEEFVISHKYDDGVHTISGEITLPTPCHELNENIRIAESFPEQVFMDLFIIDTGGICIQVLDQRSFSIDVEVDEAASFSLTIDGESISVPVLPFDES